VVNEHRPVCIHKDGVFFLDDAGGLSGFADFLGTSGMGEESWMEREKDCE
jgi:hypothetical protein